MYAYSMYFLDGALSIFILDGVLLGHSGWAQVAPEFVPNSPGSASGGWGSQ